MDKTSKEKILKAGKIASEVRAYAKNLAKKGTSLKEIADKIEAEIIKLKGKPAFPTNISINEIAAHYTPSSDDETKAHGLLKIDFGVQIDGFVADTAFSVDLENSPENKKLIQASEEALENAIKLIESKKSHATLSEIGKTIQSTIESHNATPISNLSGHSIEKYELHSGVTIPNIDTKQNTKLDCELFAIEPFATSKSGSGRVYDGKSSGIYQLINSKTPRSPTAREILLHIEKEYSTLPFCERWLVKKFGVAKAKIALRELENNGNLHQYAQLIEHDHKPVAQSEHTILIEKDDVIVTTR